MKFKKIFLFFISTILGLIFVIYLLKRADLKKILKILSLLSWWQILLIFLISILNLLLIIKKWQILTKPYNYKNKIKNLVPAILGEQAISYLTPIMYVGGEGFKAYLIKKNENKSFVETFGLVIVDRIAEGIALLFFLIIGGIISLLNGLYFFGSFLLFFSFLIIILIITVSHLPNFFSWLIRFFKFHRFLNEEIDQQKNLQEKIDREINIIKNFPKQEKKYFLLDIVISFFSIILLCSQIYFLMFFWGYKLNLFEIYLIRSFILLAGLVPTPGSVGGFEGAVVFVFNLLNFNLEHAFSFILVIRFIQLILVLLGLLFLVPYLGRIIVFLFFKNNEDMIKY